jgi:hypothetical protein
MRLMVEAIDRLKPGLHALNWLKAGLHALGVPALAGCATESDLR